MKPYFFYAFQMSKTVIFEINYYLLGNNQSPYFHTSAAQFNQPKSDFNHCGQAQETLLKGHSAAMDFYKKWDSLHGKDLTQEQYNEMQADIEILKEKYNYILQETDINFSVIREFSKQLPKRFKKAA